MDAIIKAEESMRPRLLDLFCGAGGCSVGYERAGFDVVGVDIKAQSRYPFEFHQADAIDFLAENGRLFDAIHASPPCQAYSNLATRWPDREHPDLLPFMRDMLNGYAVPWVIENVQGAPIEQGPPSLFWSETAVLLCGSMFGLKVRRHRLFESSDPIRGLRCNHTGYAVGVYGHAGGSEKRPGKPPRHSTEEWKEAMGIDWMTGGELAQAIPPAYTEYIGRQLLGAL